MTGSRSSWLATGAVVLALIFFAPWKEGQDDHDMYMGDANVNSAETLIHRLPPQVNPSGRMPLLTILSAVVFSHRIIDPTYLKPGGFIVITLVLLVLGNLVRPMGTPLLAFLIGAMAANSYFFNFTQTLYAILVLILAGILILRARRPSLLLTAAASLAIGATLLCRSPLALFPPVLVAFEHFYGGPSRKSRLDAALLCLLPYLPLIPWIWMNGVLHGRFIPFEDGAAHDSLVAGALGLIGNFEGDVRALLPATVDAGSAGAVFRWALMEIVQHPLRYALAVGGRLLYVASLHPIVAVLGSWAAWCCRRQESIRVLALLAAYFVAVHCTLAVSEDYFYPLWPLLALLAGTLPWSFLPPKGGAPRACAAVIWGLSSVALGLCTLALIVSVRYGLAAQRGLPPMRVALDRAIARAPAESWLLFKRGQERLQDNDLEGAVGDFAGAARGEPPLSRAWFRQQWALSILGRPNKLLEAPLPGGYQNKDNEIFWQHVEIHLLKAIALQRKSRRRDAERELRLAVAAHDSLTLVRGPDTPQGQAAYAQLASGSERLFIDKALELSKGRPLEDKIGLYESILAILSQNPVTGHVGKELLQEARVVRKTPQLLAALDHMAEKIREKRRYLDILIEAGELPRALDVAEQLLVKDPRDASLLLVRAELLLTLDSMKQARASLADVEKLSLDESQRRRAIGLSIQAGAYPLALRLQEPLLGQTRTDASFLLERAELLLKSGSMPEARSLLADVEKLSLDEPQRRRAIGLSVKMRIYPLALRLQEPLLGQTKTDIAFLLERAELFLKSGLKREARSLLADVEKLSLDEPQRHRAIGLSVKMRIYPLALRLQEPLMSAPGNDDDEFWLERAKLQQGAGDKPGALQSLVKIKDLSASPEKLHEEALLYQELGAAAEAEKRMRRLVERQPGKGRYQAALGILLFTAGRLTESAFHLGEALRLDPEDLSASLSLASVYLAQGKMEEAGGVRKQALEGPCRKQASDRRCKLLEKP